MEKMCFESYVVNIQTVEVGVVNIGSDVHCGARMRGSGRIDGRLHRHSWEWYSTLVAYVPGCCLVVWGALILLAHYQSFGLSFPLLLIWACSVWYFLLLLLSFSELIRISDLLTLMDNWLLGRLLHNSSRPTIKLLSPRARLLLLEMRDSFDSDHLEQTVLIRFVDFRFCILSLVALPFSPMIRLE